MDKRSTLLLLGGLLLAKAGVIPRFATVVSERDVNESTYDFIIAGAGPSGLTLADRLTEDANVKVLVIEAGPLDKGENFIYVPGFRNPSPYFWPNLNTQPQTELNNQVIPLYCGKVVGGGSTVNSMVFLRATSGDFDAWESLGNRGWGWNEMLQYYKKSENFTLPNPELVTTTNITWDASVRGFSGPVQYTYPNYVYPASANWMAAIESVGVPYREDPSGGSNPGVFALPFSMDATNQTWTRSDARRNHYDRVDTRPNYHLLTETTVAKITFKNNRATGVEYLPTAGGNLSTVRASKEVIVSAGALHTPQILMLSGIGPRKVLESLQIPVISDLPGVGQNLQDQYTLNVPYTWSNPVFPNSTSLSTNATYNATQYELYLAKKPSAYTISSNLPTNFGFVTLKQLANSTYQSIIAQAKAANPAAHLPSDIDPTVLAGYKAQRELMIQQLQNPNMASGSLNWNTDKTAQVFHLKPLSRGNLTINSTNPLANPVYDLRSATDPIDFKILTAGLRMLRTLMSTPAMAELGPTEVAPYGAQFQTDDEILSVLRAQTGPSAAHQCCTAAMLPRELGGVVDYERKVYGVQGLRVSDISNMPMVLAGPPTATQYATGEKVADMIKHEYCLDGYCN
ncbi:hypothetical protein F5884DRAFT_880018 [Xylogone sp. PMI_703]|nr:hypothetical protein F5884DRAFT_880018 [Xylogone sp. PMI_703]